MSSSREEERGYHRYDCDGGDRDRGYGRPSNRPYQDSRHKPMVNENGMHTIEDTVYITNLPQDVTEEKLAAHFGSIGIIKTDKKLRKPKIWIYLDKSTQLPKGDATLTYDDPPSADAAIEWFGGKEFMGNIIQVSKAERKMPAERGGFRGNSRGGYRGGSGGGSSGPMGGNSGGNSEPREGDWSCEKCGASNFSRRNECFKCHAQKSTRKSYGRREERRHDRRDRPY